MVRPPLSQHERAHGAALGELLRDLRGDRSMVDVAAEAGISVETVRKIERGRVPTPAFITVAAIAAALGVSMDVLDRKVREATAVPEPRSLTG
jgi:transcriptional regulator with XRE-family HTH domain